MKKIFFTFLILIIFISPALALDINNPNDKQVLIMFDRQYNTQDLLKNNIARAKLIEDITNKDEILVPAGTEVLVKITDIKDSGLHLQPGSFTIKDFTFKDIYDKTHIAEVNETVSGYKLYPIVMAVVKICPFKIISEIDGSFSVFLSFV